MSRGSLSSLEDKKNEQEARAGGLDEESRREVVETRRDRAKVVTNASGVREFNAQRAKTSNG